MSGGGATDIEEEELSVTETGSTPLLDKRVAVVTGGTRGIGRGIAEAFAAQGAAVVLGGRSAEKGAQALDEMGLGDRATFVPCDVRRREDIDNLIDQAVKRYGSADIMVNNAGGSDRFALVHEMTDEAWQNALDLNLNAVFWGSRHALRYMLERGWGRIINISSAAGLGVSKTGIQAYTSAKAGLIGLTRQMAHELGPFGVTVNCIAPGFVLSNPTTQLQWESYGADGQRQLVAGIAMRRLGQPADIAGGVQFFAAPQSSWVTGQTIAIDGGSAGL
jgi:3-oxoacyl-[acyl-carrier protein] reductase